MKTDNEVRVDGLKALTASLGQVEAERFVTLLLRDPFDYTQWRQTLMEGQSIEELSARAMEVRRANDSIEKNEPKC